LHGFLCIKVVRGLEVTVDFKAHFNKSFYTL